MKESGHTKKMIAEMNRYYDARAPWHDQYMGYQSNRGMEKLLEPIISSVENMICKKRVLEIACGTGNWTQVLAKRATSVTAVDISPKALEIAREKIQKYDNVTLMVDDAYKLDKVMGPFDTVFAVDWWSHIPKQAVPLFLKALKTKLQAEAVSIFIDMSFSEHFRQFPCYYDKDDNRISVRKLPDGSEFKVIKNFPGEAELRKVLADHFASIEYYEFPSLARWMIILRDARLYSS